MTMKMKSWSNGNDDDDDDDDDEDDDDNDDGDDGDEISRYLLNQTRSMLLCHICGHLNSFASKYLSTYLPEILLRLDLILLSDEFVLLWVITHSWYIRFPFLHRLNETWRIDECWC